MKNLIYFSLFLFSSAMASDALPDACAFNMLSVAQVADKKDTVKLVACLFEKNINGLIENGSMRIAFKDGQKELHFSGTPEIITIGERRFFVNLTNVTLNKTSPGLPFAIRANLMLIFDFSRELIITTPQMLDTRDVLFKKLARFDVEDVNGVILIKRFRRGVKTEDAIKDIFESPITLELTQQQVVATRKPAKAGTNDANPKE